MSSPVSPKDKQSKLPGIHEKTKEQPFSLPGLGKKATNNQTIGHCYQSLYELDPNDIFNLGVYDSYGVHRIVYDLFEMSRSPNSQDSSGILHADLGKKKDKRQILILSNREPRRPERGSLETRIISPEFFMYPAYRFAITINPVIRNNNTGKIVPIKDRGTIEQWFSEKTPSHGFEVVPGTLQINSIKVDRFTKGNSSITLGKANLAGLLYVRDRDQFIRAVRNGIGRGKAFGCGLLQIVPV